MKSLVEEASSVSKAVEKAWIRAGKPTSFSVKIYEEAQSGFLGFNSKPAKIGLFFEEQVQAKTHSEGRKRHHPSSHNEEQSRQPRFEKNFSEKPADEVQEKRPHHQSTRDKNDQDSQRPPARRRRPQPFEKKEFDRGSRPERPDRPERSERPERNDRPEQQEYRERRRPAPDSFERKEQSAPVQATSMPEAAPVKQPEQAQKQQAPQSTRRVLKVSSRRYIAPKNNSNDVSGNSSSDDDSKK